jgi:hypothetical protein
MADPKGDRPLGRKPQVWLTLSPMQSCLDHGALGNYEEWVLRRIGNDKRRRIYRFPVTRPYQVALPEN